MPQMSLPDNCGSVILLGAVFFHELKHIFQIEDLMNCIFVRRKMHPNFLYGRIDREFIAIHIKILTSDFDDRGLFFYSAQV